MKKGGSKYWSRGAVRFLRRGTLVLSAILLVPVAAQAQEERSDPAGESADELARKSSNLVDYVGRLGCANVVASKRPQKQP